MSRTLFSSICFLFFAFSICAQQDFIKGKLLDAKTGEPIPFATIRIKHKPLGVISNQDGGFQIPQQFRELGEALEISCIGYQTMEHDINALSQNDINVLRLTQSAIELDEAIVKAKAERELSARQIVRQAIKAIPDNYPTEPFSIVGYYRDYQLFENQRVNLNEALVEVFDFGFAEVDSATTKTRIYEALNNYTFPRDTLAQKPYKYAFEEGRKVIDKAFIPGYGGNELTILRVHDAIRNYELDSYSFVRTLKRDLISNHSFSKDIETILNNEPLYVIRFVNLLPDYSAYGKMYISKINFAIHKMEYTMYDNNKESRKPNKHGTNKEVVYEIFTEYHENRDKMFLNYISFNNRFQVWEPPKFLLEYTDVDIVRSCFVMVFNKEPDLSFALDKNNYVLQYKGQPIKFRKIELDNLIEDKNVILLYPDMFPNKIEEMMRVFEAHKLRSKPIGDDLLTVKVVDLKDLEGNLINTWTSKDYNQFREFFAQEIKPNAVGAQDTLYMKKYYPIFMDQPISRPENMEDYWMNTPLKSLEP